MRYFRDHAHAMRVIGHTFAGHQLREQPCQSWMVRHTSNDGTTESAYHFVVTWIPGRSLIVTGDLCEAVYTGVTHFAYLDATVRLVREASFDYLSSKSTHRREFDCSETARAMVAHAYSVARRYRDFDWFKEIIAWADLPLTNSEAPETCAEDRMNACRELLGSELLEHDFYDFEDAEIHTSWPAAAHWHYEALRTWANLMTREIVEAKRDAARAKAEAAP